MSWPQEVHCHDGERSFPGRVNEFAVRAADDPLPRCTYCGSIRPEDLAKVLADARTRAEWADWKYGFPHKLYLDAWIEGAPLKKMMDVTKPMTPEPSWVEGPFVWLKFYSRHLLDVPDGPEWEEVNGVLARRTGISFYRDARGVRWLRNELGGPRN